MMNLDELRSFLDATNVSEKECMKRLQEARAWMTSPGQDKLQTTDVIDLYNASRKCAMHDTNKQVAYQIRSLACMLLKRLVGPSISESLDLLRCFARTGHVLRGASVSSHVIASPEVCFSEAITIYRSMGLNHLSKTKSGVELEEICEDIWDAFEGHLSCITSVADMVQDIHDLRMFMPYLPQNATKFVKLVMNLAESHRVRDARDAEATLLGIALELIETLDNIKKKSSLRRTALVCLVDVYIDMEMLDRAETCWTLLMSPETPQGLQSGVKLHLKSRAFPRALSLVEQLQEHDNYELACDATRMYSATVGYHDGTVFPLWETLKVNFPANAIQIDMELATELAFSEHQDLREKSCSITARLAEQWPQFAPDQLSQLKKVIHDASCNATNYDLSELRLGDFAMALQLATEALNEEMSKKSLFACFRVLVSCDDASSSATSVEETLVRLIECDDFDIYDMVAFGREAHQAKNHASVLQVCETLAKLLSERICATNELPQLEVGVLYQNMAQLNNRCCESLSTGHDLNLADLNLLAVPAQTLHLSSLRTLNLRHNNLTSLPVDFVECFPLLEVLNVAQNHLSHLPPDMGSLQKLRKLFVQSNQLRSLPLSLTGCTKLDQLFAQHNHLQDIPDEFALLSSLQILSVAHNELTTLPKGLSALVKLEVVDLSGNAALTDVPENIRRLHDRHAVLHSKYVLLLFHQTARVVA
ncbi:hypothetical protein DYB35_003156 [Aphanomyces astaci]|uniref:Uncharacterized protein n=1 Tax=Aphanomyces astaci TaxID=112090 RepID=A0A418DA58_APHAT|nr:hypothetical protein DYB35_003156 [Aphanomyces astaci]